MLPTPKVAVALTLGSKLVAPTAIRAVEVASRAFHGANPSPTPSLNVNTGSLIAKQDFIDMFGHHESLKQGGLIRVNLGAHRYLFKVSPSNRTDHLQLLWKGNL